MRVICVALTYYVGYRIKDSARPQIFYRISHNFLLFLTSCAPVVGALVVPQWWVPWWCHIRSEYHLVKITSGVCFQP